MNDLVSPDIPSEFKKVTVASTSFSKMLSPLDDDFPFSSLKILLCQILITKDNQLIELVDGEVKRIERLNFQDTKKVIVYHEFTPVRRFLVCYTKCKVAYLLLYGSLEMINQWNEIKDIYIDDLLETGKPQLQLLSNTGGFIALEEKDFIIGKQSHDVSKGKEEAKAALANKLKACLLRSQSLQLEYQRKELYVIRKLSDITHELKSYNTIAVKESSAQNKADKPIESSEESLLKILTTRQRLVYGKWIICVSVVNTSSRYLICEPQLTLHCSSFLKRLCYETKFMKTVQRTNPYQESDSDIFVEQITPPILRPSKRAYLIAICRMPDFTDCRKASCSGLISFKVRSLRNLNSKEDNENANLKQIRFPPVELYSSSTKSKCIDLSNQSFTTGFSMDVMALVASSVKRILTIVSLVTPLIQVIQTLSNNKCIVKMPQLNNFYFFNTSVNDPLHYAAFSCQQISAHKLSLTTYTRDDNQCYLLLRNLQKMLPQDILFSTTENEVKREFDNIQNNLISKMYECITVISNKGQSQSNLMDQEAKKIKTISSDKCTTELYEERRRNLEDIHKDIVWNKSDYVTWRELLHNFQIKMEQLYCSAMYE